jgi:hypothetical protein
MSEPALIAARALLGAFESGPVRAETAPLLTMAFSSRASFGLRALWGLSPIAVADALRALCHAVDRHGQPRRAIAFAQEQSRLLCHRRGR